MKFAKKLKVGRAVARRGAKFTIGAGKIASAAGYTGVGRKMQKGGRIARAGTKGQGRRVIKNLAR
jgi:hypothetical protein